MENIGKYEILERIGAGGFGTVYKGRDPFLKRIVAIKTCTSEMEEIRRRFYREAEIVGSLQHPNVTMVHDFGIHEEVPYLVQEYLTGEDLDRIIARRDAIPQEVRLGYLLQVARGLEYAHSKSIIHRDIKPANIRVLEDGSVKIMDFGIAKLSEMETQLTKTGMMIGTAAYLAPEQVRAEELDQRCDIFAFGTLAYELLSYQRAFRGETISNLFYQILNAEPRPSLPEIWPDCPSEIDTLLKTCLRKEREERYASISPVVKVLESLVGVTATASPVEGATRLGTTVTEADATREAPSGSGFVPEPTSRAFVKPSRVAVAGALGGAALAILATLWLTGRPERLQTTEEGVQTAETAAGEAGTLPVVEEQAPTLIEEESTPPPEQAEPPATGKGPTVPPPAEKREEARPPPPPAVQPPQAEPAQPHEEPEEGPEKTPVEPDRSQPAIEPVPEPSPPEPVVPTEPPPQAAPEQVEAPTPIEPADEVAGIRQCLADYERAFEDLSPEALTQVWPSLGGVQLERLTRSFAGYRSLEMEIGGCEIEVEGATATASCRLRQRVEPKVGRQQTLERTTVFHLRKQGQRWVIESL